MPIRSHCYIIRKDKPVQRHRIGRLLAVGFIGTATCIVRHIVFFAAVIYGHPKPFRQTFPRKRTGPFRSVPGSFQFQVMVKIPAADHVISRLVIRLHILIEHGKLPGTDLVAAAVGRHMHIVEAERFFVRQRYPRDGITAVQIHKPGDRFRYGKAPAHGCCDLRPGICHKTGLILPVRLPRREKKEGGVIVLRISVVVSFHKPVHQLQFINMIRTCPVPVHFLQQHEIRIRVVDDACRSTDRGGHTVRILAPGRLAAVHEETVFGQISAETDIVGHDRIGLPGNQHHFFPFGFIDFQSQFIRKTFIGSEDVDHVACEH